nr:PREDICTED: pro-cathepsin H-like isoform X1 [Bemisia tabaci]
MNCWNLNVIHLIYTVALVRCYVGKLKDKPKIWSPGVIKAIKASSVEKVKVTGTTSEQFERFIRRHGRSYKTEFEKKIRFKVFQENLKIIKSLNEEANGSTTFGITPFTDWTTDEFRTRYHLPGHPSLEPPSTVEKLITRRAPFEDHYGRVKQVPASISSSHVIFIRRTDPEKISPDISSYTENGPSRKIETASPSPSLSPTGSVGSTQSSDEASASSSPKSETSKRKLKAQEDPISEIDWRDPQETYPKIKNQGDTCGSCWAFACIGAMEVLWAQRVKKLFRFSEQELIDCVAGNDGCDGGTIKVGLEYLKDHGVTFDDEYPFTGANGTCKRDKSVAGRLRDVIEVNGGTKAIIEALQTSPVVVAFHFPDGNYGQFYKGGLFNPKSCTGNVDHSGVIVGVTKEGNWIFRNSYGDAWGIKGHAIFKNGACLMGDPRYTYAIVA